MILEKSKNYEELTKNVELILNSKIDSKMLAKLKEIFIYLLKNSIEDSFKEEIIEKIDLKLKEGVDENMSCLQERLVQEFRQEIRNEFKELLRPFIINNIPDELMLQSKKITKKQLEEIKKEVFEEENKKAKQKNK